MDSIQLREGDVVKVELGVHIDGHASLVCETFIINSLKEKITDRRADCYMATHLAAQALVKKLTSKGAIEFTLAEANTVLSSVAKDFNCNIAESAPFTLVQPFHLASNLKVPTKFFSGDEVQAWSFNIVMSTGEGKSKKLEDVRPMIYECVKDAPKYALKRPSSRQVFSALCGARGVKSMYPLSIRNVEREVKGCRMGLTECYDHGLVSVYPILQEVDEEAFICKKRFIVVMYPNKPLVLGLVSRNEDLKNIASTLK